MSEKPVVDSALCIGCGLCVNVCVRNGIRIQDDVVIIVEAVECDWCALCEAVCPVAAIRCPFEIVILE